MSAMFNDFTADLLFIMADAMEEMLSIEDELDADPAPADEEIEMMFAYYMAHYPEF